MKSKLSSLLFLCFILSAFHSKSFAASSTKDLEKKISDLERKTSQLEFDLQRKDRPGRVSTFIAENISLGGFFEHAITGIFSKDHSYKMAANSNLFAINLDAKLNEKFSFISQELFFLNLPLLNEHNAPARSYSSTASFGAIVAHAYGEYYKSEKFRVQLGIGWSPFGIVMANREFPLYLRRGGPQLAGALPEPYGLWNGIHLLGEFDSDLGAIGYDAYSITSPSNSNRMGGGSRLWWKHPNGNIKLGTSSQVLKRSSETIANVGGDLDVKFGKVGFRTEYAQSVSDGPDLKTAYLEPYITLSKGKWIIHGELDFANRPVHFSEAITTVPFKRLQYGAGVNWLPWPFLKTRLLFLYNDYLGASAIASTGETNDFYTVEYSTGIEF